MNTLASNSLLIHLCVLLCKGSGPLEARGCASSMGSWFVRHLGGIRVRITNHYSNAGSCGNHARTTSVYSLTQHRTSSGSVSNSITVILDHTLSYSSDLARHILNSIANKQTTELCCTCNDPALYWRTSNTSAEGIPEQQTYESAPEGIRLVGESKGLIGLRRALLQWKTTEAIRRRIA